MPRDGSNIGGAQTYGRCQEVMLAENSVRRIKSQPTRSRQIRLDPGMEGVLGVFGSVS